MADYPAHHQSRIALGEGLTLELRPIRRDDAERLLNLYHRLSRRSLYQRFFTVPQPDPAMAAYLADVDYDNHFALVAELEDQIIAVARYHRLPGFPDRAEAAFTVADNWQGRGIGPLMLERLAQIACEKNIASFEAEVLTDNRQMIKVLSRSRFEMGQRVEAGVFYVTLRLAP